MTHVAITSAQLAAIREIEDGYGVRIHSPGDSPYCQVDVLLDEDRGSFRPYFVWDHGETLNPDTGRAPQWLNR